MFTRALTLADKKDREQFTACFGRNGAYSVFSTVFRSRRGAAAE